MKRVPILIMLFGVLLALAGFVFNERLALPAMAPSAAPRSAAAPRPAPAPAPGGPVFAGTALPPVTKAPVPVSPASAAPGVEKKFYDQLIAKLRGASYAFNHPDVMYVSRRSQVSLVLAATEVAAVEQLKQQFDKEIEGGVNSGATKIAPVMIAVLRGKDFVIDPTGEQERLVLLDAKGPAEWTWYVEPREAGPNKLLVLELYARLAEKGSPPLNVQTLQARVKVDVKMFDFVIGQAQQLTPIARVMSGVGGVIAMFGFLGTMRRWWRGRH